jgi:hypothetical protein
MENGNHIEIICLFPFVVSLPNHGFLQEIQSSRDESPGIVKGGWVCYHAPKDQGAVRRRATNDEGSFHAAKHNPDGL